MKLLQESPVAFLAPLSKPPESLYVAEIPGSTVSAVIAGTDRGLVFAWRDSALDDFRHDLRIRWDIDTVADTAPLAHAISRYEAYFEGDNNPFDVVVQPFMVGPFTLRVHRFMSRIPHGDVMTYGEVAAGIGNPAAARAVGNACGKNRVLIAVPCHRIIASNGLGGYGGGLHVKERLLEFEGADWKNHRNLRN